MRLVETTDVCDEWFADLDEDAQVEVIASVELLKLLGPRLGRPHADTKFGISKKRSYKQLIDKADQLYAAHLAALKARKKGRR
jgi:hypothetical protein